MSGVLNFSEKMASIKAARGTQEVGHQSWNSRNLYVKSYHNDILYYTTRRDALCPYIEVTEETLERAPKPFIAYAMPPDSVYGVPINDHYGFVGVTSEEDIDDDLVLAGLEVLDDQQRLVLPGQQHVTDPALDEGHGRGAGPGVEDRDVPEDPAQQVLRARLAPPRLA